MGRAIKELIIYSLFLAFILSSSVFAFFVVDGVFKLGFTPLSKNIIANNMIHERYEDKIIDSINSESTSNYDRKVQFSDGSTIYIVIEKTGLRTVEIKELKEKGY